MEPRSLKLHRLWIIRAPQTASQRRWVGTWQCSLVTFQNLKFIHSFLLFEQNISSKREWNKTTNHVRCGCNEFSFDWEMQREKYLLESNSLTLTSTRINYWRHQKIAGRRFHLCVSAQDVWLNKLMHQLNNFGNKLGFLQILWIHQPQRFSQSRFFSASTLFFWLIELGVTHILIVLLVLWFSDSHNFQSLRFGGRQGFDISGRRRITFRTFTWTPPQARSCNTWSSWSFPCHHLGSSPHWPTTSTLANKSQS